MPIPGSKAVCVIFECSASRSLTILRLHFSCSWYASADESCRYLCRGKRRHLARRSGPRSRRNAYRNSGAWGVVAVSFRYFCVLTALAASQLAAAQAPPPPAAPPVRFVLVLDAAHGGDDSGAHLANNQLEKS